MAEQEEKMDALQKRMNQQTTNQEENNDIVNEPNQLEGYKVIERQDLPQSGVLYPESWQFAYRCPEADEVANFSTINEKDQPGIIRITENLIKKCIIIFDIETEKQVSTSEINDCHRLFFMLLLRDEYILGDPLNWNSACIACVEELSFKLSAKTLIFKELSGKLLEAFDGRIFTLDMGLEEPIQIYIPTLKLTSKVFNYIVKAYRDNEKDNKKADKIIYDKQFLLLAPYLFETGDESVSDIKQKYNELKKDAKKFKIYLEILTKLKIGNESFVESECIECGSLEVSDIRFPGWKTFFISTTDTTGYFN